MNLQKALNRDRRRKKKVNHGRDGDSVKELQRLQEKRRQAIISKHREEKEKMQTCPA